jgi:uncharacterized protein (TIGR03437 family)
VSVAQGSNGPTQTVDAYNAGDGNLNLSAASSVPWLAASIGAVRACNQPPGTCLPVVISLNTSSLPAGTATGFITVSDANALDAPQSISVTVQAGGGIPDQVTLYVAPNGSSASTMFTTNSDLRYAVTTASGGPWLSLSLGGGGSFRFTFPYRLQARHLEGMGEGTYQGSVAISNSNVAAENKTLPVTLQVTSQPIAAASVAAVRFGIGQGGPNQQSAIVVSNSGFGTLATPAVSASTSSGGNWLTAQVAPNTMTVSATASASGLSPGVYSGSISIATNAANGTITIPAELTVLAAGPPVASFGGVVNSGAFDNALAPGSVAALFGEQLSTQDPAQATQVPLAEELNGVRVLVNDQPAPLFFVSANQVNFQVPYGAATGDAVIRVERGGQRGNGVSAEVKAQAPRLIRSGIAEYGVVVNQDGSLALPDGRPARPGEAITIYAVGLGATSPAATSGAGAPGQEPLARVTPTPLVMFGGAFSGNILVEPIYAGLTPSLVGLYQITVIVPNEVPSGDVILSLVSDAYLSNRVMIPIR